MLWHNRMDVRGQWPKGWSALPLSEHEIVVSAKYTHGEKGGVRISCRDVDQLIKIAAREGREPVLCVAFGEIAMIGFFMPWGRDVAKP